MEAITLAPISQGQQTALTAPGETLTREPGARWPAQPPR